MDPTINNEQLPRLRAEAQEAGTDLEVYSGLSFVQFSPFDNSHHRHI